MRRSYRAARQTRPDVSLPSLLPPPPHLFIQRLHCVLQLGLVLPQLLALRLQRLHIDAGGRPHVALDVVHGVLGSLRLLVQTHQHCRRREREREEREIAAENSQHKSAAVSTRYRWTEERTEGHASRLSLVQAGPIALPASRPR